MNAKDKLSTENIPAHIAVIMDGNGRWAKAKGEHRVFGHQNGVAAVRNVTEASAEIGVKVLTLYTFSTENWNRPKDEVDALMTMLVKTISEEEKTLMDNDIALKAIGDLAALPAQTGLALSEMINKTAQNKKMQLVLALNYSSRWEITQAFKNMAKDVEQGLLASEEITQQTVNQYLTTKDLPDPDLLIRTSGEYRLSNFLLWQVAYSELYFSDVLWPDFSKEEFYQAVVAYQQRERRFGKISEQLQ
ncbi:MAG: isoprenyl transferase [Bacteroidales bacterium]|jgi:undecaprenyl diphosphate synthase|nr:isoprenyl transferase [Bacteroidales bacterium]